MAILTRFLQHSWNKRYVSLRSFVLRRGCGRRLRHESLLLVPSFRQWTGAPPPPPPRRRNAFSTLQTCRQNFVAPLTVAPCQVGALFGRGGLLGHSRGRIVLTPTSQEGAVQRRRRRGRRGRREGRHGLPGSTRSQQGEGQEVGPRAGLQVPGELLQGVPWLATSGPYHLEEAECSGKIDGYFV